MSLLHDGRDHVRLKTFNRRALLVTGGSLLLMSGLVGRMYQLQVLESDRYSTLAEDNRINLQLLTPPRGLVLDRFGQELAANRQNFRVIMVPEQVPSVEAALDALGRFIVISDRQRERILRDVRRNPGFVPITVAENLTWEEFAQLNFHSPDLPGLELDVGETRDYPYGDKISHILGYVAPASEKDQEGSQDPLLRLPGFRVGRLGVEKAADLALRGRAGARQIEVNAQGRVIRELSRRPGDPGDTVVLTLDMEIQKFAQARLNDEAAACVVMDVHNGDVLALVSHPAFDPNAFNKGITQASYDVLLQDQRLPLLNKAIQGQYPPGSTIKMLVAIAAVEHNVISPETSISCSGAITFGGHRFHCWKRGGHGPMNMVQGIKHSCDVYFYELARRLGVNRMAEMFHRFGLGETFGFEVPGEKAGIVPTVEWKRAAHGEPWNPGETLITGIGQGFMLSTPLQLAVMTARIANGGRKVMPHIFRSIGPRSHEHAPAPSIGVSERAIQIAQAGMDAVTNAGGTAARSRIDVAGFEMAGKTGTSQVRRITAEERARGVRKNEDLPWHLRDHGLFVAYAPATAPRYAISVIVQHGGGGSKAAAPPARDIMLLTLQRDPSRMPAVPPVENGRPLLARS